MAQLCPASRARPLSGGCGSSLAGRGRDLISTDPLAPGTVYSAGITSDGTVGLYRVEVSVSSGTGKLKLAGGVAGAMKESVQRAFSPSRKSGCTGAASPCCASA